MRNTQLGFVENLVIMTPVQSFNTINTVNYRNKEPAPTQFFQNT